MKPDKIVAGETYTYFPPKKLVTDNEHYSAKILDGEIKRGRVNALVTCLDVEKIRSVAVGRLEKIGDLIGEIE